MDSRIILTQADFSANNIGRYVEISDLTKKVLAKQTQYDEQSEEAAALNTFLNSLTTDGFIGGDAPKLSVLLIPALAGVKSELWYNICSIDSNGYPRDWTPSAGASKYEAYEKDGYIVGGYPTANVGVDSTIDAFSLNGTPFVNQQKLPSFSLFTYLSQAMEASNPSTRGLANYNYGIGIKLSAAECLVGSPSSAIPGTNQATATTSMSSVPVGFYSMSYDGDNGHIIINNVGNIASSTVDVSGGISGLNIGYVNTNMALLSGNANTIASAHSAIVGFGAGLTQEELATLKGYCDTLAAALHVTN